MNITKLLPVLPRPVFHSLSLVVALLALAASAGAAAGEAQLRGLLGQAQVSRGGTPFKPVAKGETFAVGDVIQTAAKAAMDIDFGGNVGTVRLTQLSTLVIEKWSAAGADQDLSLFLRDGEILGRVTRPAGRSRLELKVNSGIGGIVEGQFRLDAKGYLVLVEGKGAFVHVPATGEPAVHSLTAPPAVYFSPVEGVRPASPDLVREIAGQWRSKLPRR